MMSKFVPSMLIRTLAVAIVLFSLAPAGIAQFVADPSVSAPSAATPLIQSLSDKRFEKVTEDWTTPALATSHLQPVPAIGLLDDTHPGYSAELDQVQWRWNDALDLYVMKPKGVTKPPVILYLFGYPTDSDVFRDEAFQTEVTRNGFAAVCFVSALTGHRYHSRPMKEWFISELQESLGKSAHDVQMILNYLATRGDLDMNRVGMFGQKSGASVAILASAVDPRIKVLDLLNPWGDWPTWMASSPFVPEEERRNYVTPEFLKKAATLETVDWLPKVQVKQLRFQDAVFEATTPKGSKEKLRAAAPAGTTFVFYKDASEFSAAFPANSLNLDWMKQQLRLLPQTEMVLKAASSTGNATK